MTLTVCWSAKGGSGTTVVAAALAFGARRPSLLVDAAGDLPAALGIPEPCGQGLSDWFDSPAPAAALLDLAVDVGTATRLVARGPATIDAESPRWSDLRSHFATVALDVVVDAGCGAPPPALVTSDAGHGDLRVVGRPRESVRSLLVTRACYLSIVRAIRLPRPDGIVLVEEPLRGLTAGDIASAVGAPVVARVPLDPAVARAVDAGLLAAKLPRSLLKELTHTAPLTVHR